MPHSIFFACPQMEILMKRVHQFSGMHATLGHIRWENFPDGFPKLFIEKALEIEYRTAVFFASFDTPDDIFRQLAVIYALPHYGATAVKIVLPFYPTGTMERVTEEGEIATAVTLARMLAACPNIERKPELITFDIHAPTERFYFQDKIRPKILSAITLFRKGSRVENFTICYPDDGAYKRFAHRLRGTPHIRCDKMRDGEKRQVNIIEGNPTGKDVVIVDDLIMTGGTMIECKNALLQAGSKTVSIFAPHGVFPQESWRKFIDAGFAHIWITDSCPRSAEIVRGQKSFEVLSLAGLIARAIRE